MFDSIYIKTKVNIAILYFVSLSIHAYPSTHLIKINSNFETWIHVKFISENERLYWCAEERNSVKLNYSKSSEGYYCHNDVNGP